VLEFTLRRLLQVLPVVVLSSVGVFLLLHLVPGDPVAVLAGPDATPETIQAMRQELGLDRSLPVQYGIWLGRVLRGDFGRSYAYRRPVGELILQRIPATVELALAGLALALLVAIPTGVLAAVRQGSVFDWLASTLSGFAIAMPNFWFGILAIIVFSLTLGWLPPGGMVELSRDPVAGLWFLVLPAVTLALNQAAVLSRFVKASVLEVLNEDYVRTARAKGLSEAQVTRRHVVRAALIPVATVLGLEFGRLLGGAVIVESVFAWPGMGRLIVQGILHRDYPIVQATLLLLVITFVAVNLVTDLVYGLLDPRIRLSARRRA
jgi:ABC-type dipeptide/oligopeptide/nickel transport system permease component